MLYPDGQKITSIMSDENNPEYNPKQDLIENVEHHPASVAVNSLKFASASEGRRINGQLCLEDDGPLGVINVFFCVYPGGDYFYWMIFLDCFAVVALVDEKIKVLGLIPVLESEQMLKLVNHVGNQLNMKNNYPVEDLSRFTPSTPVGSTENPPDTENA